jgi:flagellar biosynthesis/type III secretory pathway chaperone
MNKKRLNYYTNINKLLREKWNEINDLYEDFLDISAKNGIKINRNDQSMIQFVNILFDNCRFHNDMYKLLK